MIKKFLCSFVLILFLTAEVFAACGAAFGYKAPSGAITDVVGTWRPNKSGTGGHYHQGTDIDRGKENPNTNSAHSGVVKETGWSDTSGYYVIVESGGVQTVYMHAGSISVKKGDVVNSGTSLGNWGTCTGRCNSKANGNCLGTQSNPCSSGQHVHMEIQVNTSTGLKSVDKAVFEKMIAEGKDPCDPNFGNEAWQRTQAKIPNFQSQPFTGTGNIFLPGGGNGTPVPSGGMCAP